MLILGMLMKDIFFLGTEIWYEIMHVIQTKKSVFCNLWFVISWVFDVEPNFKLR